MGGGDPTLAVATALPISLIGQIAETIQNSVINVFWMHRAENATQRLDTGGLIRNNTVWPMITNGFLYGLPTFFAIYFGGEFVQGIINAIPEKIISGLAVGGGMIGAVGFALLLSSIKAKHVWPFFFLGFLFAAYLHVNMIGIALLAVICVALYYYANFANKTKEKVA